VWVVFDKVLVVYIYFDSSPRCENLSATHYFEHQSQPYGTYC
jgi:hypothetical protein